MHGTTERCKTLAAARSAALSVAARGRSRLSRVLEALVSDAEEQPVQASFLLTRPSVFVTVVHCQQLSTLDGVSPTLSPGDTGTIDDNYRSIWPYVWGNPEALNAMQRPLNLFNDHQTYAGDFTR